MIPLHLSITGFLSYGQKAEIDFTSFDIACISGANGAGKSSLLDAITWVLFGQARRKDDALINNHKEIKAAEVVFEFSYENNIYRIQRTKPRDKSAILEFQVLDEDRWRALTEKSARETELRIQRTLRLDYEPFTNASFFLQGKADQFAQQRPGDRKRILSSILGLEVWETYREGAANRRKALEIDLAALDSRLGEINTELGEEGTRREKLKELETSLAQHTRLRQAGEANLDSLRRLEASLAEQQRRVEVLAGQLQAGRKRLEQQAAQVAGRRQEQAALQEQLAGENEVRAAYAAWQSARQELEAWDGVAASFRQVENRRAAPLMIIEKERSALEQERSHLLEQQEQAAALGEQKTALEVELGEARLEEARIKTEYQAWQQARLDVERWEKIAVNFRQFETLRADPMVALEKERAALQQERSTLLGQQHQAAEMETQQAAINRDLQAAHTALEALQTRLEKRPLLEEEQSGLADRRAAARSENEQLRLAMNELKDRIGRLNTAEGAVCPVCGQPLSPAERQRLVESLEAEGREQGDRFRANQEFGRTSEIRLKELTAELDALRTLEKTEFQAQNRRAAGLEERLTQISAALAAWQANGAKRLVVLETILAQEDFGLTYRQELARIDGQMKELGYDAQAHAAARQAEEGGRSSSEQLKEISSRLAALDERLKQAAAGLKAWRSGGEPRLVEVQRILGEEDFAAAARIELGEVDAELKALGYDAAAHDAVRRRELDGRASQEQLRMLENARAALGPLERQIAALEAGCRQEETEVKAQEGAWAAADQKYQADRAALPDSEQAERELDYLREQENIQSM